MAHTRSTESEASLPEVSQKIDRLVPHILQLENAAIFLTAYVAALAVAAGLWASWTYPGSVGILWFVPYAGLPLLRYVIRIRNPYNRTADVTESGLAYAGGGALIGGSITGLLSGGLGAPAGAAIGGGIGFVVGIGVGIFKTRATRCKSCGKPLGENSQYCTHCGKPNGIRCDVCASISEYGSTHCANCGHSLTP
jgi:hypothetical protein